MKAETKTFYVLSEVVRLNQNMGELICYSLGTKTDTSYSEVLSD